MSKERLKIIALMGRSKSGKDTAGDMLAEAGVHGHKGSISKMAFADKLKGICMQMFGLSIEDVYSDSGKNRPTQFDCLMCPECHSVEAEAFKMDNDPQELGRCKVCGVVGDITVFRSKWTPRTILQFIGTEGFRRVWPAVWTQYALMEAKQHLHDGARFVVLTDCRFPNEAEAVWAAGGEVWRIYRPETDKQQTGLAKHASETAMDAIPDGRFQAVIHNDSTLDAFRGKLNAELKRFLREHE